MKSHFQVIVIHPGEQEGEEAKQTAMYTKQNTILTQISPKEWPVWNVKNKLIRILISKPHSLVDRDCTCLHHYMPNS